MAKNVALSNFTKDKRILARCARGFDWDEINDDEPLQFGNDKDVSLGWNSTQSRFDFSSLTGSESTTVYQMGNSSQLKVHNRPSTTGSTVEVRHRDVNEVPNVSGAIDSIFYLRPTTAVTGGQGSAIFAQLSIDSEKTVGGDAFTHFMGMRTQVYNAGTLNGAGLCISGLWSLIGAGGTWTAVKTLTNLWLDCHLETTPSAGHVSFIVASNNGAASKCIYDDVLQIQGEKAVKKLFTFTNCVWDTPASGMISDETSSDYTFTNTRTIKIDIDGVDYYLVADRP